MYFLNYYDWIVSGDASAYQKWNESLQFFGDKEKEHTRKYGNDLNFPAFNFIEANIGAHLAENTIRSRNSAAILSFIFLVLVLYGLALKPGSPWSAGVHMAAGALVLPFRHKALPNPPASSLSASISMLLLSVVLGTLPLTFFAAPVTTATLYGFLATYLILLFLFLGRKNPPALIATLSPIMLLLLVYLLLSSVRGPGLPWYLFWTSEGFRLVLVAGSIFLLLWSYVVLYAVGRKWFNQARVAMASMIVIMEGIQLALLGAASHVATLETSLTAINDELAVLPGGLSRILGITTHLNIPTDIPVYLMAAGLCLTATGFLILWLQHNPMFKKGDI
jgi:hypothetical protein